MTPHSACARAHANIALAKYWGKANAEFNLPAVPSVSLTLRALSTTTTVTFDDTLDDDLVFVGGKRQQGRPKDRVTEMLDRVRAAADFKTRATVESVNNFPTASGLASSASAFAALALASISAAGLDWDSARISDLARRSSASAGRSLFGGFVRLPTSSKGSYLPSECIAPPSHWDVRVIVAVTSLEKKAVSSTRGMNHTAATSPYFDAWVNLCSTLAPRIERAILAKDIDELGKATEQSALSMHASALAAAPGVLYFEPATLHVLKEVWSMRSDAIKAYATVDAGPHVKVITTAEYASVVVQRLQGVQGVLRTIASKLGGPAIVIESDR